MSSSTGGDGAGSGSRCSTAGNDDDDDEEEEEEAASRFTRVVWLRQMLHRWRESSSNSAAARSSSASASGERANDDDPAGASTDRAADNDDDAGGSGSGSEIRDPLLPASADRTPWMVEGSYDDPDEEGGGGSDSPMTPMTPDAPVGVPRGCCPVYVGLAAPERRRFVVPTSYLGMPVFRRLLEKAEEEFEFHYGAGGVIIPCDTEAFKYILLVMERHRQGLVDDEGNAKEEDKMRQRGGCGSSSSEVQDEATMAASSGADGGVIGAKAITLHET